MSTELVVLENGIEVARLTEQLGPPPQGGGAFVGWRVRGIADQLVPRDVDTVVKMGAARFDTNGFFNPAAPDKVTIPAGLAGFYLMGGGVRYRNTGNPNFIGVTIVRNRVIPEGEMGTDHRYGGPAHKMPHVTTLFQLDEGDDVELWTYHNATVPLTIEAVQSYSPEFWGVRLG